MLSYIHFVMYIRRNTSEMFVVSTYRFIKKTQFLALQNPHASSLVSIDLLFIYFFFKAFIANVLKIK